MENISPETIEHLGRELGKDTATINKAKQLLKNPEAAKRIKKIMNKTMGIKGGLNENIKKGRKIGRNDKCPCNSNKKYKKCCLDK